MCINDQYGNKWQKEDLLFRLEAIRQTERERRNKYKKQDDERDLDRQKLRDKYKIAKPVNEDEESEDEDDAFGSVKKGEEDADAVARELESFLAGQDSSIGYLVTDSLTHWLTVLLLLTYKERP